MADIYIGSENNFSEDLCEGTLFFYQFCQKGFLNNLTSKHLFATDMYDIRKKTSDFSYSLKFALSNRKF